MTLQSIMITGYNSGVQRNKKPFLITDDAFSELYNAYIWREQLKKREGLKLLGRLRRVMPNASIGNTGASPWSFNIYTAYGITAEIHAEIEPGSVIITIAGPIVFTDQGNGLFTGSVGGNSGTINYVTGDIVLTHTAGAGVATTASFNYFPSLPVMGIWQRERVEINDEQTIFFDQKYAYIHDGANFQEFLLTSPVTTWNGTNSDFFWATNYRGADANVRLFFVTNFVNSTGSPMRYTDGSTWTTFQPILSGTSTTQTLGAVVVGAVAFAGVILTLPIIEGSVVITLPNNNLTFKDTPRDGTLVSSGDNTGTINYNTGAVTLTFSPALTANDSVEVVYDVPNTYLFTARILIPYYGRLVALNVYEGQTNAGATNIFNRARFSQVGSPIQQDAWRSDVFGKGGFVDAPVNEEIVSARYYKNVLIVQFERSTWRLQYIGEYGTPFIWERISSDWGAESTFSTVLFDNGVLAVGDKAVVSSSGNDVQRIDIDIPDQVYSFNNSDNGVKRVHGIRHFKKELVFWCYPDYTLQTTGQFYPNRTLVFNYRNNTFAFFRNNVTAFGEFQYPVGITWDRLDIFWDDYDVLWDSSVQEAIPTVVCGNQHGFTHFFVTPDAETSVDSIIDANDQESLSVSAVTIGATVQLTIYDHNLANEEWIYLTGLKYIVNSTTVGSTTLNDKIYSIAVNDKDTITLYEWNVSLQNKVSNFVVTTVGDYVGGGVIALLPKMEIRTKDFNPARQIGQNIQTSYIDFLVDSTPNSVINVDMRMNTSATSNANLIVGNQQLEITNSLVGTITNFFTVNPGVVESANHGLLDGDRVLIQHVSGTTQLNNNQYTVTYVTDDLFSIGVNAVGYTAYVSGGQWIQVNDTYYTAGAQYAWFRFFANAYGQFLTLQLTYDNDQMSVLSTHQSDFVLNAMQIYYRPAGNNIFGK